VFSTELPDGFDLTPGFKPKIKIMKIIPTGRKTGKSS
jgi:hypothetical protein